MRRTIVLSMFLAEGAEPAVCRLGLGGTYAAAFADQAGATPPSAARPDNASSRASLTRDESPDQVRAIGAADGRAVPASPARARAPADVAAAGALIGCVCDHVGDSRGAARTGRVESRARRSQARQADRGQRSARSYGFFSGWSEPTYSQRRHSSEPAVTSWGSGSNPHGRHAFLLTRGCYEIEFCH